MSLLLDKLDLKPGDEILLSVYNYHVVPFLIKSKGFVPVFVDIDPLTFNMKAELIEEKITPKTKCVIATHLFGLACRIEEIVSICKKHRLLLIEDATHACGCEVGGKKVGSFGDFSFFSFGTGKTLMAFGGGMVVSHNEALFAKFKEYLQSFGVSPRSFAQSVKHKLKVFLEAIFTNKFFFTVFVYPCLFIFHFFHFDPVEKFTRDSYTNADINPGGKACRFSCLQAVIGLSQLWRIDHVNDRKILYGKTLRKLLEDIKEVQTTFVPDNRSHVFLSFNLIVDDVDKLRKYLLFHGVDTKLCHMRNCSVFFAGHDNYPGAAAIGMGMIELPCSAQMSIQDIYYQANLIRKFYGREVKIFS